jgi:hypothetical protein
LNQGQIFGLVFALIRGMKNKLLPLIVLSLIAILSTSCGMPIIGKHVQKKSGTSRLFSSTDSTFSPYVAQFESYAKSVTGNSGFSVGDVLINFGDPEVNTFQGVCYIYSNDLREIIIRKQWWDTAADSDRESLIFHELGHCKLDRDHDDEVNVIGGKSVKLSMMNSIIVLGNDYANHRPGYLDELFNRNKTSVINAFINTP